MERSDRNDDSFSQHQGRAKRRRKGGKWKGKVMPISLELSKGDRFFLSMKSQVHDDV